MLNILTLKSNYFPSTLKEISSNRKLKAQTLHKSLGFGYCIEKKNYSVLSNKAI